MDKSKRNLRNSHALLERARRVIPSCTQTFSKGPTQWVQGVAPIYLQSGKGAHVFDADGNEYIDYLMALGPITLGYGYPAVDDAIVRQLRDGITFSQMHPLEVELAELLAQVIPGAEMVRFGKNGSDATAGAVRAARAITGRDKIACCGYHGWQDWYIASTTRDRGIPQFAKSLILPFEYNNLSSLEALFEQYPGEIAAVIMEPMGVVEPTASFLEKVRELAHARGALLIFDEIITGFRLALGGAQEYFRVIPDMACFGKGLGNGMPISAVVGLREHMQVFDEIFYSFTFGGEALSLAAGVATIREFREKGVVGHFWKCGQVLKEGYNGLAKEFGVESQTQCMGLPPRTVISFFDKDGSESLALRSLFMQECIKRGVLFFGSQNLCFSHTQSDLDRTLEAYREAMAVISEAIDQGDVASFLEGSIVQPIFRKP